MRSFLLGIVALVALVGGSAMAADLPIRYEQRPVMPGVFSWTGWYVGGFVGGAWGGNAHTSDPCNAAAPFGCRLTPLGGEVVSYPMSSNFIGGVAAGYNYQIPGSAIVFGLETEFGALRLKGSSSFAPVSPVASAGNLVANATIGPWYNATTVRIGWAWDRMMFYGKGGFALSTIESTIVDTTGIFGPGTGKRDILGWAWGAGMEYVFAPRWSVKAEYLWLGLNHGVGVCAVVAPGAPGAGATYCSNTATSAVQTAKIGVNYLLNVGPVYARY